jgi:hypothetical protein
MPSVFYEIYWNQKNRYSGIKEYYDIIKDVCSETSGVELFGLFKPLNEPWNWAYFLRVDTPEAMHNIGEEIDRRYETKRDNISQSFYRFFTPYYDCPKSEKLDQLKYLQIEFELWEGINVGIKEYHNSHVMAFEGQEGAWYQGVYRPWTDHYNWAYFYWFRDIKCMSTMSDTVWRASGQPERQPSLMLEIMRDMNLNKARAHALALLDPKRARLGLIYRIRNLILTST